MQRGEHFRGSLKNVDLKSNAELGHVPVTTIPSIHKPILRDVLAANNPCLWLSAPGQSRHFGRPTTSSVSLETDIVRAGRLLSKVPEADIENAIFGLPRLRPPRWLCTCSTQPLMAAAGA